jgi:hypothetical protein
MDEKGVEAFQAVMARHMKRENYREMVRMVSDAATRKGRRLRIDAVHFLALNFEGMVIEPMSARMSGANDETDTTLLDPEIRSAIVNDLDLILSPLPDRGKDRGDPLDPDRGGSSAGRVLRAAGEVYDDLRISSWRLWGG